MLPAAVVEALEEGARVVEIGVGGRFEALVDLHERREDLELAATDVRPTALDGAPGYVETRLEDVFEADPAAYREVALLVAVRAPAEMQPAVARLAGGTGAGLALSPLGDELAPLEPILGSPEVLSSARAWRYWPPSTGPSGQPS